MEELLKAVASGLKFDADQFLADFKQGEDFIPEKEIAQKLGLLISDKVKAANETAKKVGRSEVSKRFSRLIKDSGFENSENLEGEPLFSAFLEWKGEQGGHVEGDPGKMSREDLLKLPAVRDILKEGERKASEKWTAEKKELESRMTAAENTRKRLLLDKSLLTELEKAKVNLGDTAETKALRLDLLKSRLDLSRIEIGENDALRFLDADGYETDLAKEVLPIATNAFGVVTQDKNRGGGGAQGSSAGGGGGDKYIPTHTFQNGTADFAAKLQSARTAQERFEIQRDWKFHQESEKAAGK